VRTRIEDGLEFSGEKKQGVSEDHKNIGNSDTRFRKRQTLGGSKNQVKTARKRKKEKRSRERKLEEQLFDSERGWRTGGRKRTSAPCASACAKEGKTLFPPNKKSVPKQDNLREKRILKGLQVVMKKITPSS